MARVAKKAAKGSIRPTILEIRESLKRVYTNSVPWQMQ